MVWVCHQAAILACSLPGRKSDIDARLSGWISGLTQHNPIDTVRPDAFMTTERGVAPQQAAFACNLASAGGSSDGQSFVRCTRQGGRFRREPAVCAQGHAWAWRRCPDRRCADGGRHRRRAPAHSYANSGAMSGATDPVNGVCTCPAGLSKCGPDCCNPTAVGASHSECCDNACCFGYCYGEELCCEFPREFCPITGECCASGVDCCANDGCCPNGACVTSQGAERCCPSDQYCPGDVRAADLCCPAGSLCCGAGTAGRLCVDPAVGGCCQDSDCPAVGTACGACVDHQCVASPCGACEACFAGECVECVLAGYGCCNNDDVCVECCSSEQCGPYFDCDLYICEPCEVEGRVPCGEPPCIEGPGNRFNCCCEACGTDADCGSCQVCFEGGCRNCEEVGLECFGGTCGECGSSEDAAPISTATASCARRAKPRAWRHAVRRHARITP